MSSYRSPPGTSTGSSKPGSKMAREKTAECATSTNSGSHLVTKTSSCARPLKVPKSKIEENLIYTFCIMMISKEARHGLERKTVSCFNNPHHISDKVKVIRL